MFNTLLAYASALPNLFFLVLYISWCLAITTFGVLGRGRALSLSLSLSRLLCFVVQQKMLWWDDQPRWVPPYLCHCDLIIGVLKKWWQTTTMWFLSPLPTNFTDLLGVKFCGDLLNYIRKAHAKKSTHKDFVWFYFSLFLRWFVYQKTCCVELPHQLRRNNEHPRCSKVSYSNVEVPWSFQWSLFSRVSEDCPLFAPFACFMGFWWYRGTFLSPQVTNWLKGFFYSDSYLTVIEVKRHIFGFYRVLLLCLIFFFDHHLENPTTSWLQSITCVRFSFLERWFYWELPLGRNLACFYSLVLVVYFGPSIGIIQLVLECFKNDIHLNQLLFHEGDNHPSSMGQTLPVLEDTFVIVSLEHRLTSMGDLICYDASYMVPVVLAS